MAWRTELPLVPTFNPNASLDVNNHTENHQTVAQLLYDIVDQIGLDSPAVGSLRKRLADAEGSLSSVVTLAGQHTTLINDNTSDIQALDNDTYSKAEIDTLIANAVMQSKQEAYPIGSLYYNANVATNPATLLGFGTWVAHATGRVLVGVDGAQAEFDTLGETGGAKTHTLTANQSGLRSHNHTQDAHGHNLAYAGANNVGHMPNNTLAGSIQDYSGQYPAQNGIFQDRGTSNIKDFPALQDATATNQAVAASNALEAHNNLQPYITVYIWKRTA